ncbi:MAG: hypothetical protein MGF17_12220 [Trichodesmium sp. MAG_R04]|nr:hypothetical protein [Trichodesmium sp. MAG_R04]
MAEKLRDKYIQLPLLAIPRSSVGTLHTTSLHLPLGYIRGGSPTPEKDFFNKP